MLVPHHLEPAEIVARRQRHQKKSQRASQKRRFQAAAQTQERKIERSADDLGQGETQLPTARGNPVDKYRQYYDREDEPAHVGPERQVEKGERDGLTENRGLESIGVLEWARPR